MNLLRILMTVSGLTLLSRITGLIREILIASIFGANQYTDAFNIAFRIPNLLRRLSAEGAFSQAFIPMLSGLKSQQKNEKHKIYLFIDSTSTVLTWILVIISVFSIINAPYILRIIAPGFKKYKIFNLTVTMTRVMFPYIIFISLTSLTSGILNIYRNFSVPAFTPVLLNISLIISATFIAPHIQQPILCLSGAVIVGGLLQLIFQLFALWKIGIVLHVRLNIITALTYPGIKDLLLKMLPAILGVSIAQISLIINTNIASKLTIGSVSWLSYADRVMEFPTAILGTALSTILLPNLSKAYLNSNYDEYSKLLDWGLRLTFLFAIPSTIILFFLSIPITSVLFNYGKFSVNDILMVSYALEAYALSLIGLMIVKILAPAFYARQDIITPAKCALIALISTQISNNLLVPYIAHAGLALSIGIGASINGLLLYIILYKRNIYKPSSGWFLFFIKLLIACIIFASVIFLFSINFDWIQLGQQPLLRSMLLCISIITSIIIYIILLYIMKLHYCIFKLNY